MTPQPASQVQRQGAVPDAIPASPHPDDLAHFVLPEGVGFHPAMATISEGLKLAGCSPAAAAAFVPLASSTIWDHWTSADGTPVNFRRQWRIAADLGITPRQVYNHEAELVQYGALIRLTPDNGERGIRRDQDGAPVRAFGLCFAPAIRNYAFYAELVEEDRKRNAGIEAERAALQQARGALKTRIIRLEHQDTDPGLVAEARALQASLPPTNRRRAARSHALFGDALADVQAMLTELSGALERGGPMPRPEANAEEISGAGEESCQSQNTYTTEPIINVNVDHTVSKNEKSGREASVAPAPPVRETGTEPAEPGSPPPQSALQLNLSDQAVRDLLSLDFHEYFEAQDPELPAYTRLYLAAAAFHGILGINLSAWDEAVRVMGGALAALVVAVIDRNRFHPTHPVHSPGGLLRDLTQRFMAGTLHLDRSIYAIWANEKKGLQPKDGAWSPRARGKSAGPARMPDHVGTFERIGTGTGPVSASPDLGPFPARGSLRYTPWYRVMLQETNRDACQVTELFRRFMAKHNIAADDPHLEKKFRTYCRKLPRA